MFDIVCGKTDRRTDRHTPLKTLPRDHRRHGLTISRVEPPNTLAHTTPPHPRYGVRRTIFTSMAPAMLRGDHALNVSTQNVRNSADCDDALTIVTTYRSYMEKAGLVRYTTYLVESRV